MQNMELRVKEKSDFSFRKVTKILLWMNNTNKTMFLKKTEVELRKELQRMDGWDALCRK